MKCKIMYESRGRMRLKLCQHRMTLEQADLLEAWLLSQEEFSQVKVHERTCCVIVNYSCDRKKVLDIFRSFSYETAKKETEVIPSGRELSRTYEEKIVTMVMGKVFRDVFFPAPVRMVYTTVRSIPYLLKGVKCLLSRQLKVEVLDALSVGISVYTGDYATAGSVMFLLRLGELLEEWTHKKSVSDLARTMSLNVDRVWLVTESGEVLTPVSKIRNGDRIALHMGNMVPFDGLLMSGEVMANQASLTGESIPVAKREGMMLYAGSVIEEGECTLSVEQQDGMSRYDKVVAMIEETEKLKSDAENKASNLADKLVPYSLAGSALTYLLSRNSLRAMSVLMVDFSCALKLAMPLGVLSAMREAGNKHITVKGGKYLEAIAKADTIVFDKTGTLTHACPKVVDVIPFGGNDPDEMLRIAACLEEHYPHSMANAVVQAARERDLKHDEMHSEVEYVVAHGIASAVNGKRVLIGSSHFVFEDEDCRIPETEKAKFEDRPPQYSHLYLAIGQELAAIICVADPLREEAKDAVAALKALGVTKTVMLTGDSERTAAAIAAEVGVDAYRAEVLPEDKAQFVEQERKEGRTVIMIGDGINDSPALSAANVGIAISDGAAIAREIADVTISAEDLFELVVLKKLSKKLMQRIDLDYRFIMGFNGSLIGLGALGILSPATSAMLHNVSTLGISMYNMTDLL